MDVQFASEPKSLDLSPVEANAPEKQTQEHVLRRSIESLLQETADEEDTFTLLREVCLQTLGHTSLLHERNKAEDARRTESLGDSAMRSPISAPKSPQERLMALVPQAYEKGKSRYQRRGFPSPPSEEFATPRWQRLEGDEAPVTDLTVIHMGDTIPDGFTKLERSPTGLRADLNKGVRGAFVYLCQKKDHSSIKMPISEILIFFPERGEVAPPDYEIVQRRSSAANLNMGTQGERIYMCFRRSTRSSITDIMVLFPKKGEKLPYGYVQVDKTPDGHFANLNANSRGAEVCICYKRKLAVLSDLHKKWLHMSLILADEESCSQQQEEPFQLTLGKRVVNVYAQETASPKVNELQDIEPVLPVNIPETKVPVARVTKPMEYYMYPLLLACYMRQGTAADAAIQAISKCVDADIFMNSTSRLCGLDVVVDAVASICHQGVKARFALALPFFRKVIRKHTKAFDPMVLHAIMRSVSFIGDFDSALVKSVEDEMVDKIMDRYEALCTEQDSIASRQTKHQPPTSLGSEQIAHDLVIHLIDDVSSGADIAKRTENLLGIFKSHSSIHTRTFCADLVSAMDGLVQPGAEQNAYQLVVTLTKAVHRKAEASSEEGAEREHASILNSLRALNGALLAAGPRTREHRVFGQMIRRLVLTTVNSLALIWSPEVFRANLTLMSTLWSHYRRYLKVEFALLFEHLVLRILKLNQSSCATTYQTCIMEELTPWFQLPHNVVEIFFNFDMDRVQQWKIFEHLCGALCSIADGSTTTSSSSSPDEAEDASALRLQILALTMIVAMARSIMDASGHAHLISHDARTRLLSMENGGWEQDESSEEIATGLDLSDAATDAWITATTEHAATPVPMEASSPANSTSQRPPMMKKYGTLSVRMRNELQKRHQQLLTRAKDIAEAKSLKKAIEFLVAMNVVKETPRDITSFLRIHYDVFDEAEIGDYLGEGDEDFKVQVRLTYVRAISFKGMTLVASLRHFLTNGGFRLPGEAQKIERMVDAFAQCYWEDCPSAFSCADTAMIIAYSIIMLNTDLHNPQVKKNKMSRDQFVKNNRGIDNGRDLPRKLLESIYDDIAQHPMHVKGSRFVPAAVRESSGGVLLSQDAEKFHAALAKSVAQSDELMKDLSQSYVTFNFVGVDTCISPDLIRVLFERVWFHLLALAKSILTDAQADLSLTTLCLDLLRYGISTCLFMDMALERRAFCNELAKLQQFLLDSDHDASERLMAADARHNSRSASSFVDPSAAGPSQWMDRIEASSDDPLAVMGEIHVLVNTLKQQIERRQISEELNSVVKRISRSHLYLKDSTHFIREGDLTKKCRSRNRTYRFFLFNDQLMYADRGLSGYWHPHKTLRLRLTRLSDVADTVLHKHAFQIHNPDKSFVVFADSAAAKAEWMRVIEDAIEEAVKKINRNARRISKSCLDAEEDEQNAAAPPVSPTALSVASSVHGTGSSNGGSSAMALAMKGFMRRGSRGPSSIDLSGLSSPGAADSRRTESQQQPHAAAMPLLSVSAISHVQTAPESAEQVTERRESRRAALLLTAPPPLLLLQDQPHKWRE